MTSLRLALIVLLSVVALATVSGSACAADPPSSVAQERKASELADTITFKQPRVTGLAGVALKRFAQKIAPSKKNRYQLEHVDVDVFINPASDGFTRTAAANMGNEVARRLTRYGVPRDKITHSTQGQERAETHRGTYDVELRATGSMR